MARILAFLLTALILLQTFSQELVVLDYQVHKAQITRLFCINKARPQLHCNGRCHLAKQLRKSADAQSKAPTAGFAKIKYEALPPLLAHRAGPAPGRPGPVRFGRYVARHYAFTPAHGIFHPPAFGS